VWTKNAKKTREKKRTYTRSAKTAKTKKPFSQGELINAKLGSKPITADKIVAATKLPRKRVMSHLNCLRNKKRITETPKGFVLK
jgi:Fic family protein